MKLQLVVGIGFLALALAPTTGRTGDEFPYERYVEGTLQAVIDLHREDAQGSDVVLSADDFPSRVKVVYSGKQRSVPSYRAEFLDSYFKFRQLDHLRPLLESEILVKEGGQEHWVPIQKPMLAAFEHEVKGGAGVTLFVAWLGALRKEGEYEWLFSVNEFQATQEQ